MDQPKCDCVGADTEWAPLLCNGFRKSNYGRLGGGVVRLSNIPVETGRGGNIDDGSVFTCFGLKTSWGGR